MAEYTEIYLKRDSTLNWYASNPRLGLGEPGIDMDLHRFKIGNGIDRWNELPYMEDDLYNLLDKQQQDVVDKVRDILDTIDANELSTEQNINALQTEIRNTSKDLTDRMSAVEEEQEEYQEGLSTRQQEFEEALTGDFEDTKAELQAGLDDFSDTKDALITRMDAIVGQATEDTEILDARVDAEYRIFSNLGGNIRHVHSVLLKAIQDSADNKSEVDNEIAILKAADIQEQQARLQADEVHDARVSQEEDSTEKLFTYGEHLQERTDRNAESLLNTALLISGEMLRFRDKSTKLDTDIAEEKHAREAGDTALSGRFEQEYRDRKDADNGLSQRLDTQGEKLDAELKHERLKSVIDTEELGKHIDRLSEAAITGTLLLDEENEKLRTEKVERIKADEDLSLMHDSREDFLQEQVDETAGEVIGLNIKLYEEQQARRSADTAHEARDDELSDALRNVREGLQSESAQRKTQSAEILEAVLSGVVEHVREHEEREQGEEELSERIHQSNDNLKREEYARTEDVKRLDAEIQPVADALIRESLDRYETHSRLQKCSGYEEKLSASRDEFQDEQINDLADSNLQQTLNLRYEAAKRLELEQVVAGIKSPVDWSSTTSLAIPEPRCAVVNFSGLDTMPASKTADIPAVMEFWDMQGNFFRKNVVCSAQGASSLNYVKKNVKFDLLNDDGSEFCLRIGSWIVQDSFHLKAYYTDIFRGVAVASYKLWDEILRFNGIMKDRPYKKALIDTVSVTTTAGNIDDLSLQLETGALCHPDGFPCIVYLNGEFYGIYSWQLKKHRDNYHLSKSNPEHIHLDGNFKPASFWNGTIDWTTFEVRNPSKLYTMNGKKYDGDNPSELIDQSSAKYDPNNSDHVKTAKVKQSIQSLVQRFQEFKAAYSEHDIETAKSIFWAMFDMETMRDYMIFHDVTYNWDGITRNVQWTTYDGVKWYANAYDLDVTYGITWDAEWINAPIGSHGAAAEKSQPFGYVGIDGLCDEELVSRYIQLRKAGIIDTDHIMGMLRDWVSRVGWQNYKAEYERWPDSPCNNPAKVQDNIYRVQKWLEVNIARKDRWYGYVPITTEELIGEINSTHQADIESINSTHKADTKQLTVSDSIAAKIRADNDTGLQKQVDELAQLELTEAIDRYETYIQAKDNKKQAEADKLHEDTLADEKNAYQADQINELADAIFCTLLNEYKARETIKAHIRLIEETLVDAGLLDESNVLPTTDTEINGMFEDIFSGNTSGITIEPNDEEEAEFLEDINSIFNP